MRGCSSVVERQLPKLNVEGSTPFTRFLETRMGHSQSETFGHCKNPKSPPEKPKGLLDGPRRGPVVIARLKSVSHSHWSEWFQSHPERVKNVSASLSILRLH